MVRYVFWGHLLAQKLKMSVVTFITVQKHPANDTQSSVVGTTLRLFLSQVFLLSRRVDIARNVFWGQF